MKDHPLKKPTIFQRNIGHKQLKSKIEKVFPKNREKMAEEIGGHRDNYIIILQSVELDTHFVHILCFKYF